MWRLMKFFIMYWKITFVVIFPILALPIILLNDTKPFRCLYTFIVMCAFWITEALAPPITSLLPMFMFPLLGVLGSDTVARNYMNDTNMMLIGSTAIAVAMENTGLQIRIALYVIKCIGCSIRKLHIGLCMVTMFMSMWIANTAATVIMIPIVEGTLVALQKQGLIKMWHEEPEKPEEDWRPTNITICYYISIAYCSCVGGTGCIIGSGTYFAFKGIYETRFPDSPGVEFAKWMMFNVPLMLLSNILIILWLQIFYMGPFSNASKNMTVGPEATAATKAVVDSKIEDLGPMTFKEFSVGLCFLIAITFWFFKRPGFMPGWPEMVTKEKCGDAVIAITVFVLFFLIPLDPGCLRFFSRNEEKRPLAASSGLLTWKLFAEKMPWGMLFVLGGGFALTNAAKESGLSKLIAEFFRPLLSSNEFYNLLFFSGTGSFITQFVPTNVACVTMLMPIILDVSMVSRIHPMYLGLSTTLACSYSYFLPFSTPPNALVAGPSRMGAREMMVSGIIPFVICLGLLFLIFPIYSPIIWDFNFPDWARIQRNGTTLSPKINEALF